MTPGVPCISFATSLIFTSRHSSGPASVIAFEEPDYFSQTSIVEEYCQHAFYYIRYKIGEIFEANACLSNLHIKKIVGLHHHYNDGNDLVFLKSYEDDELGHTA